jgi:hypothetical protein
VSVLSEEDSVGCDVFNGSQAESPNIAHSASIILWPDFTRSISLVIGDGKRSLYQDQHAGRRARNAFDHSKR